MRRALVVIWIALPLGAWAYHEGPGQEQLQLDAVAGSLRDAQQYVADESWVLAIESFDAALAELPGDRVAEARQIRLDRNKARMMASGLPDAHADLEDLVEEMANDVAADPKVLADSREALASANYYLTWLKRLEGKQRAEWEPNVEAARQSYRLLAEQAQAAGDQQALERHQQDLESTVRLARMELQDLQGLPLPSQ